MCSDAAFPVFYDHLDVLLVRLTDFFYLPNKHFCEILPHFQSELSFKNSNQVYQQWPQQVWQNKI